MRVSAFRNYPSVAKTAAAVERRKRIRDQKHQNYLHRMEEQKKFFEEKENRKRQKLEDSKDEPGRKRRKPRKQKVQGSNPSSIF